MEISKLVESWDRKIERAERRIADLLEQKEAAIKSETWQCESCNAENEISDTPKDTLYWYEIPHGCMGGDTWHTDKHDFYFYCPSCNAKYRAYHNKWALEAREYFAKGKDVFER